MSEIDPDIQMPEEEPNTPEDQSSPQPPEKTPDVEVEDTLENMQELIDQIDSLEQESDVEVLKEIESQLPLNPDPAEDEAKNDAVIDPGMASMDDDLDLLLDDIDQVVVQAESETSVTPGEESPPAGDAASADVVEDTPPEADIEAVTTEALKASPAEPDSISEESIPIETADNDSLPVSSDAASPGGVESPTDISSEIDALLSQVKVEKSAKAPEPKRKPVVPAPEAISSTPTGEESELKDLNNDLDDLFTSAQEQPESDERSRSSELSTTAKAVGSIALDTDQSLDIAGAATPAKSEEPKTTPVQVKQKNEALPSKSNPGTNVPLTPQDMAMRALDEAMADDVAQMIAGDSEALESVLDGIFDEQAILVQNEEGFMPDSAQGGIIQSDEPIGDSAGHSGSPSVSPTETATDIGEVIDEEIAALGSPETPKETATTSATDLPASDQEEADQVVQEQVEQKPVAQEPVEAMKVADAAEVEAAPGEPQLPPAERENKWQDRVMVAFEIIEPPLVTVLSGLNYPLRKIPKRLRPAVDWLALSLVFWVPIVWVLAMFVV